MKFLVFLVEPADLRLPANHNDGHFGAIYLVSIMIITAIAVYLKKDKE